MTFTCTISGWAALAAHHCLKACEPPGLNRQLVCAWYLLACTASLWLGAGLIKRQGNRATGRHSSRGSAGQRVCRSRRRCRCTVGRRCRSGCQRVRAVRHIKGAGGRAGVERQGVAHASNQPPVGLSCCRLGRAGAQYPVGQRLMVANPVDNIEPQPHAQEQNQEKRVGRDVDALQGVGQLQAS